LGRVLEFILIYILWILLTWSLGPQYLLVGLVVAALTSLVFGGLLAQRPQRFFEPKRYVWFIYYLLTLIWYIIKANLDVAYRVLHPDLPIRPGIVKVRTTLENDVSKTFLSNSITLTPGTLTVDVVGEEMYIHWINVRSDDAEVQTEIIVSRFENILKRVFE
jgi:multicomponent Na+:H+ antiporter subunit E